MSFQNILSDILQEYHYSQTEFAKIIGVKQSQISEWLKGKAKPSYDTLKSISEKLNISTDYLLGRTDDFDVPIVSDHGGVELSADEQRLLSLFQGMSHQQKLRLIAYAEGMSDASKKNRLA